MAEAAEKRSNRWRRAVGVGLACALLPCLLVSTALYLAKDEPAAGVATAQPASLSELAPLVDVRATAASVAPPSASSPTAAASVQVDSRTVAARLARDAAATWALPALCGAGHAKASAWSAYLQSFRRLAAPEPVLFAEAAVRPDISSRIAELVSGARRVVQIRLSLDVAPPAIYVHRNPEALRAGACVNASAVAFYDGAIHLAVLGDEMGGRPEMWRSLVHEYTHHALLTNGVREPIWLQEGLAMHVAGEHHPIRSDTPIDLREMVDGFPHGAPPEHAARFYDQAYAMVAFLHEVCGNGVSCRDSDFVAWLRDGSSTPSALFTQTIERLRPDAPAHSQWQAFLARPRPKL